MSAPRSIDTAPAPTGAPLGEILLGGLDGTSLTGFLAALGVLRLLSEADGDGGPAPRLAWEPKPPHRAILLWRPETEKGAVKGMDPPGRKDGGSPLAARVAERLVAVLPHLDPFPGCHTLKDVTPETFRAALEEAAGKPCRLAADLLAALGSDGAPLAVKDKEKGKTTPPAKRGKGRGQGKGKGKGAQTAALRHGVTDAPWSVMNGAQHRCLLDTMRRLSSLAEQKRADGQGNRSARPLPTLEERLATTLFGPWAEADEKASLGLEPALREHAYRWKAPTDDPPTSEGLANLLALIGLSCLPAVPVRGNGAMTTEAACCVRLPGGRTAVSWPLWRGALGLGATCRLLRLPEITAEEPPDGLSSRGVAAVMRTERFLIPDLQGAMAYTSPKTVWFDRRPGGDGA